MQQQGGTDKCPQDELSEEVRESLLDWMRQLEDRVRVMITLKPHLDIDGRFTASRRLDVHAHEDDIRSYLAHGIRRSSRLSKFISKDPDMEDRIISKIVTASAGMLVGRGTLVDFV